jgi:hypothetical protein
VGEFLVRAGAEGLAVSQPLLLRLQQVDPALQQPARVTEVDLLLLGELPPLAQRVQV